LNAPPLVLSRKKSLTWIEVAEASAILMVVVVPVAFADEASATARGEYAPSGLRSLRVVCPAWAAPSSAWTPREEFSDRYRVVWSVQRTRDSGVDRS
jgi:hypothetical protein